MSPLDRATAAFRRYVRHEFDVLREPIEEGAERLGFSGTNAAEMIRRSFESIIRHFEHRSGALTPETAGFWRDIEDFCKAELAASSLGNEPQRSAIEPDHLDVTVLRAASLGRGQGASETFDRVKMLLWRFAAAVLAADEHGTTREEAALEEFKTLLDAESSRFADP